MNPNEQLDHSDMVMWQLGEDNSKLRKENAKLKSQLAEARKALGRCHEAASRGVDWNLGHQCVSRNYCQSVRDISTVALAKLKEGE